MASSKRKQCQSLPPESPLRGPSDGGGAGKILVNSSIIVNDVKVSVVRKAAAKKPRTKKPKANGGGLEPSDFQVTYQLRFSERCCGGKDFLNVTSNNSVWDGSRHPSDSMKALVVAALDRAKRKEDSDSNFQYVNIDELPDFMWGFLWSYGDMKINEQMLESKKKSEESKKGHGTRRESKASQRWKDGTPFQSKDTKYDARKNVFNELMVQSDKSTARVVEILSHVLSKVKRQANRDSIAFEESHVLPVEQKTEIAAMELMMERASSCVDGMKRRISSEKMSQLTCLGAILLPEMNDPKFRKCCDLLRLNSRSNYVKKAVENRIEYDQFLSLEGDIEVGDKVICRAGRGQLKEATNGSIKVSLEPWGYDKEYPSADLARLARWEPSLDDYERMERSDMTEQYIIDAIKQFHMSANHESPNANDIIKEEHPKHPACKRTAQKIYRYESWEQLWIEFKKTNPGIAEKIGNSEYPNEPPTLFRTCAPWNMVKGRDASCLCTNCETTNAAFRGKKKASQAIEFLLETCVPAPPADDELDGEGLDDDDSEDDSTTTSSEPESNDADESKSTDSDPDGESDDGDHAGKSEEDLDAEAAVKAIRLANLMSTTNKYDACVACLPCIGKGGKLEDAKMSCVNGECPKCGMDKIWSNGLRRRIVKREWDASKGEWVQKMNTKSKFATDVWGRKMQWRDYVSKVGPTKVNETSQDDEGYDPNAKAARNIVLQTFEGTVVEYLDHIEKQIAIHIAHRNLVCTEHRSKKDYDRNSRPWTLQRDQDFAENGRIENFDKLQSEHWQTSQYTLFMAINSILLVDDWNKTEGPLENGNEVTVDGEFYFKDPEDVHYRPDVNLKSFWACVKNQVSDDVYCVVDEKGEEHEVARSRLRLRKRHTICCAHVSDDTKHDRFAMKTFSIKELEHVEGYLQANFPNDIPTGKITHLHQHSDNAATHFKSTGAMESFTSFAAERGGTSKCKYIWSFGAPGHGKGFFDGMGGVFKNMIHSLIASTKTSSDGIGGTKSGYINSPKDVFDALKFRFSEEQSEKRRKKGGKGKKNQVDKYMFFEHMIEEHGDIRRPDETFTSLDKISSRYQFSVTNRGIVHSRERSCWCINCMAGLIEGSMNWSESHSVPRCTSKAIGKSRSSNAYEFTKRACNKRTGTDAAAILSDRRQSRNEMASEVSIGDWLIFKSTDDPKQPFWLGRAVSNSNWDNQCTKQNTARAAKVIDGAKVARSGYAINVKWYTVKEDGGLEYIIEGGEAAEPIVCSNHTLLLTGINDHLTQVTGSRVRVTRRRTVRSNQLEGFEYSQRSNLQTSEEDFLFREYGNIWKLNEQVRDRAMELVDQVS